MSELTPCKTCANDAYTSKRIWVEDGETHEICDRCGNFQVMTVNDVFFKYPYRSEALDVEFTSRAQKAAYLKDHGLREAGDEKMSTKDWVTGSATYRKRKFDREDRPKLRQAIRTWRQRATGH